MVIHVITNHAAEMLFVQCDDVVQGPAPATPHPSLRDAILPGRLDARPFGFQPCRLQERDDLMVELGVSIRDHVAIWACPRKRLGLASTISSPVLSGLHIVPGPAALPQPIGSFGGARQTEYGTGDHVRKRWTIPSGYPPSTSFRKTRECRSPRSLTRGSNFETSPADSAIFKPSSRTWSPLPVVSHHLREQDPPLCTGTRIVKIVFTSITRWSNHCPVGP